MTAAFDAGFALAALLTHDAPATHALGALSPTLAARVGARVAALGAALTTDRVRAVKHVVLEAQTRSIDGAHEPRRVLAILATEVPRERGMVWLAAVPRQRAGWSASAGLRDLLLRQVGPTASERAERERRELDAVGGDAWRG